MGWDAVEMPLHAVRNRLSVGTILTLWATSRADVEPLHRHFLSAAGANPTMLAVLFPCTLSQSYTWAGWHSAMTPDRLLALMLFALSQEPVSFSPR